MTQAIQAIVIGIWTMLGVRSTEAPKIADAIAIAVTDDRKNEPVFSSHEEDAAVLAEIVREESRVQTAPHAYSHDARDGTSCGAFQLACEGLPKTIAGQARKALWLLHQGRVLCPESPAAPYVGGCLKGPGRIAGDRRVMHARQALRAWQWAADSFWE